jgi:hypothetical protein
MYKYCLILITASACTLSPQDKIKLLEIENLSLKEEIKMIRKNQMNLVDDNSYLLDDLEGVHEQISRVQDELYRCELYIEASNKLLLKYKSFLIADYQAEIDDLLQLEIY